MSDMINEKALNEINGGIEDFNFGFFKEYNVGDEVVVTMVINRALVEHAGVITKKDFKKGHNQYLVHFTDSCGLPDEWYTATQFVGSEAD